MQNTTEKKIIDEETCYEKAMKRTTGLGILSREEADYYISCIKTACAVIQGAIDLSTSSEFDLLTNSDILPAVFSKITKQVFWIREETETRQEQECSIKEKPEVEKEMKEDKEEEEKIETETVNEEDGITSLTANDIPMGIEDALGEKIRINKLLTNEEGLMEIDTSIGKINTMSKVLLKQLLSLEMPVEGYFKKQKSTKTGREYFYFIQTKIDKEIK